MANSIECGPGIPLVDRLSPHLGIGELADAAFRDSIAYSTASG